MSAVGTPSTSTVTSIDSETPLSVPPSIPGFVSPRPPSPEDTTVSVNPPSAGTGGDDEQLELSPQMRIPAQVRGDTGLDMTEVVSQVNPTRRREVPHLHTLGRVTFKGAPPGGIIGPAWHAMNGGDSKGNSRTHAKRADTLEGFDLGRTLQSAHGQILVRPT